MRKTAAVICPGRGTYNKPELGYLARIMATSRIDYHDGCAPGTTGANDD